VATLPAGDPLATNPSAETKFTCTYLAVDDEDNVFCWDAEYFVIRKIDSTTVSVFSGTGFQDFSADSFDSVNGLIWWNGLLYVIDYLPGPLSVFRGIYSNGTIDQATYGSASSTLYSPVWSEQLSRILVIVAEEGKVGTFDPYSNLNVLPSLTNTDSWDYFLYPDAAPIFINSTQFATDGEDTYFYIEGTSLLKLTYFLAERSAVTEEIVPSANANPTNIRYSSIDNSFYVSCGSSLVAISRKPFYFLCIYVSFLHKR
jgi:hypothetical protein